jgi:hypothetical protein
MIRNSRIKNEADFIKFYSFEVAAHFDFGASVYDDVHPMLAVLNNNIICRGFHQLHVYIEELFKERLALTQKKRYFEIREIVLQSKKANLAFEINIDLIDKYHLGQEVELLARFPDQLQLFFHASLSCKFSDFKKSYS